MKQKSKGIPPLLGRAEPYVSVNIEIAPDHFENGESRKNQRWQPDMSFLLELTLTGAAAASSHFLQTDSLIFCLVSSPGRHTLWLQSFGYVNCYL